MKRENMEMRNPARSERKWAASVITAREPAMYPPMNSMVMKVKQKQQIFTSLAIAVLFWYILFKKRLRVALFEHFNAVQFPTFDYIQTVPFISLLYNGFIWFKNFFLHRSITISRSFWSRAENKNEDRILGLIRFICSSVFGITLATKFSFLLKSPYTSA